MRTSEKVKQGRVTCLLAFSASGRDTAHKRIPRLRQTARRAHTTHIPIAASRTPSEAPCAPLSCCLQPWLSRFVSVRWLTAKFSDPVVSATAPVPGSGRAYTGLQFYKSIEGTGLETAPKIDSRSK
jgi:hypothetical protein